MFWTRKPSRHAQDRPSPKDTWKHGEIIGKDRDIPQSRRCRRVPGNPRRTHRKHSGSMHFPNRVVYQTTLSKYIANTSVKRASCSVPQAGDAETLTPALIMLWECIISRQNNPLQKPTEYPVMSLRKSQIPDSL